MKKCAYPLVLISAICFSAISNVKDHESPNLFKGYYLGFNAGQQTSLSEFNQTIVASQIDIINSPIHSISAMGEVDLGYDFILDHHFIFGVGAFMDIGENNKATTINPADDTPGLIPGVDPDKTTNTRVDFETLSGGADATLGVQLSRTSLLYAIIGLKLQPTKLSTSYIGRDGGGISEQSASSKYLLLTGWRLGFGLSEAISNIISLNFKYIYSHYGNHALNVSEPVQLSGFALNQTTDFKLNTNSFLIGLNYYFTRNASGKLFHVSQSQKWNGLFAGLAAGLFNGLYKNNTNQFYRFAPPPNPSGGDNLSGSTFGDLSAQGEFTTGFGHIFKRRYYLGLMASVGAADTKASNSVFEDQTTFLRDLSNKATINNDSPSYDVSAKLGLALTDNALIYLRGGVAINRATLTLSQNFIFPAFPTSSISQTLSSTKTLVGWSAGLGLQQMIGKGYAVSLDYIYTDYGKINISNTTSILDGARVFISNASVDVRDQVILLGIAKYFN